MLTSVTGVFRDGRIELEEVSNHVRNDAAVIVTFLEPGDVDLAALGIDEVKAAELRGRLATFVDDWSDPEMDVYNDYDRAKTAR